MKTSAGKTKGALNAKLALSALSLAATLGGWANFTLAERQLKQPATDEPTALAIVPAASTEHSTIEFTIDLPAMPTVTPLKVPTIVPVSAGVPAITGAPPRQTPAPAVDPAPAAPTALRVVSAPPRPKDGGGGGSASPPPPAAQTRSSK